MAFMGGQIIPLHGCSFGLPVRFPERSGKRMAYSVGFDEFAGKNLLPLMYLQQIDPCREMGNRDVVR